MYAIRSYYENLNTFKVLNKNRLALRATITPYNQNSLSDNLIWGFEKSTLYPNKIWICTLNNLTRFTPGKSSFERIEIANPNDLQYGQSVNSIVEEM